MPSTKPHIRREPLSHVWMCHNAEALGRGRTPIGAWWQWQTERHAAEFGRRMRATVGAMGGRDPWPV